MTRTSRLLGSLLLAAAPLGGCSVGGGARTATLAVPPDTQVLAVDVHNVRGSVELRVDHHLTEARVESNVAVNPGGSVSPNQEKEIIGAVDVTAEIKSEAGRSILKVDSTSQRPQAEDQRVDIKITVPRCDGVSIDNRGGLVMVVGAAGAHHIVNRAGVIEVRTDKPIIDPVTLTTTDGNIYYQVPPGSSGKLDLATLNGECAYRDEVSNAKDVYYTKQTFSTVLNNGENPVVARTNQGDVRVWVIKDPIGLTRAIKKSLPDFQDYLYLDGSQRFRRNLPDDEPRNTDYARWYNLK